MPPGIRTDGQGPPESGDLAPEGAEPNECRWAAGPRGRGGSPDLPAERDPPLRCEARRKRGRHGRADPRLGCLRLHPGDAGAYVLALLTGAGAGRAAAALAARARAVLGTLVRIPLGMLVTVTGPADPFRVGPADPFRVGPAPPAPMGWPCAGAHLSAGERPEEDRQGQEPTCGSSSALAGVKDGHESYRRSSQHTGIAGVV